MGNCFRCPKSERIWRNRTTSAIRALAEIRILMARNADRNPGPELVWKALICPRAISHFWSLILKFVAEIEREHEEAIVLVFARQEGRIIDSRIA